MPDPDARTRSSRVARKRQQAREDILGAAQQILGAQGTDAVTLASVAGLLVACAAPGPAMSRSAT